METRILISLCLSAILAGCASHRIGPEATFVAEQDRKDPPLEVSAAFRTDLCSPQVGYLVFSVRNPQDEWKQLNHVELLYPYSGQQTDDFSVVSGKQLIAWADAQTLKFHRETHNANMARLAAFTVSRVMLDSEDESTRQAGAAIGITTALEGAGSTLARRADEASKPAGDSSNHILADELILPPGMDRSFWVLLNASPDAPLMNWITVRYSDEKGMPHQFVTTLPDWERCGWQQPRIRFLEQWGQEQGLIQRRRMADGNSKISPYDATLVEAEYQKRRELSDRH